MWSSYYGNHQAVSISIKALHLAGTMVGGGAAVALDRQVLLALRQPPAERAAVLAQLEAAHRVVLPALVVILLTGILMLGADAGFVATGLLAPTNDGGGNRDLHKTVAFTSIGVATAGYLLMLLTK